MLTLNQRGDRAAKRLLSLTERYRGLRLAFERLSRVNEWSAANEITKLMDRNSYHFLRQRQVCDALLARQFGFTANITAVAAPSFEQGIARDFVLPEQASVEC